MKHTSLIKIAENLSDAEHQNIAKQLFRFKIDGIEISSLGGRWGATWTENKDYDLNFLKFYKGIKTLRLEPQNTTNLRPILELADSLEYLLLGEFVNKNISFEFLGELDHLQYLSVIRQPKGLESIKKLKKLRELSLTGYSADKLDFLNNLKSLKRLYIGFGTSLSLNTINKLENLEELDILWVKKLSDISAISNLSSLIKLKIEDEKQIRSLPDISKLKKLKNIRLMNLSNLEDISSLNKSFLEEFILTGPNKNADILNSISGTTTLKKVFTNFYTKKEQAKAELILGSKFCALNKMNSEMEKRPPLHYFDLKTGLQIH